MKQTQRLLLSLCVLLLAATLAVVVAFELLLLEPGSGVGSSASVEFMLTFVLELLTLGCAFLALRLFRFRKVSAQLQARPVAALRQWGVVRLLMLELPLLANTLLYYIYLNTTFGYLAVILLLCLPFVWPSAGRCQAETTFDETPTA